MNPKQIALVLLVLATLGITITLVGNATSKDLVGAVQTACINPNAVDNPSKKVTLRWLCRYYWPSANEGTIVERQIEKKFNVEIKPIFIDGTAYGIKRPLIFCGNGAPDLWWEPNPITLQKYVKHGFVAELPYKLIQRYAPTYVKHMNEEAPVTWLYCRVDGKNYGVPTMFMGGRYPTCSVWRKDWLKKVGINKTPDTLEDMHTALYRFRHNDPDGNGKMDTYGMSGSTQAWHMNFVEIYGAYGIAPLDWIMKDGKVVWGGIQPETKQALALLRQWYKEGLIDPDFVIDTENPGGRLETKMLSSKIGYHNGLGSDYLTLDHKTNQGFAANFYKLNPKADLTPGLFPKGPTGKRGARVWGSGGNMTSFGIQTAKDPEKVIRVLKIYEAASANIEVGMELAGGKRGVHWYFKNPKGEYPGQASGLPPYDNATKASMQALSFYAGGGGPGGAFVESTASTKTSDHFLPPAAVAYREKYCNEKYGIPDVLGKADVVPSSGVYLGDLRTLQINRFADIIRGAKPLSSFDDFVREWKRRGGDIMTIEARKMYKEKLTIYKELGIPIKKVENGKAN